MPGTCKAAARAVARAVVSVRHWMLSLCIAAAPAPVLVLRQCPPVLTSSWHLVPELPIAQPPPSAWTGDEGVQGRPWQRQYYRLRHSSQNRRAPSSTTLTASTGTMYLQVGEGGKRVYSGLSRVEEWCCKISESALPSYGGSMLRWVADPGAQGLRGLQQL